MWKTVLKVAAGTGGFAVVHSLLASRAAKAGAARLLGRRHRNGWYRPFYLAQSLLTFGALGIYIRPLPDRVLYRVQGPAAFLMHAGQGAALVYAVFTAHQVGMRRMLGLRSLSAWLGGGDVPPEPEAQGPAPNSDGKMRATGPFAWSRHPLNFAPVPVFWLFPTMTVKLATFSTISTLYLALGSIHEETRLRAAYGLPYREYQESGIPFYLPCPWTGGRRL